METRKVDVAVIGAGTAGLNARREAEKAGRSHVLIESGPYGTTCARVGCMPSKLLVAAADVAHQARCAPTFGVHPGELRIDGGEVMQRVRAERDRFAGAVIRSTEKLDPELRLRGVARFVEPHVLEVDDHTRVEAGAVVIATGSHAWVPPPFDALEARVDVNDDVFEWTDLPASVAVVGTGIIGLELGQALHRLGVEVAFFNPFDLLGPFTDPEVDQVSRRVFGDELDLHLGVEGVEAELIDAGVKIAWTEDGERRERSFERVLAAAGRRPNLKELRLEAAGIELDEKGRPPWEARTCQVADSHVFLAGDVNDHRPLLHEASDEGRIAGYNAARYPEITARVRRVPIAIAFTDPQIALVGARHADLEAEEVAVAEYSFRDQGRARVIAQNRGLIRLYARRKCCTFLGAELLGPSAEHLAHLLAASLERRLGVQRMLEMPFYHPTIEEGLRSALINLGRELKLLGGCRPEDLSECPGS